MTAEKADPRKTPAEAHLIQSLRDFGVRWIAPIAIALAIMLPLRSAVADWNDVPSGSMRPTLLEGDRIFVDKLAYGLRLPFTYAWLARWGAPERGDVVTFASPEDETRLVKRIIGVPGDRIAMRGNELMLNGVLVEYAVLEPDTDGRLPSGAAVPVVISEERLPDRPHAITLTPGLADHDFDELTVPEGQYFFLGDNRDLSRDSRWLGFVSIEHIYGEVTHVALSVDLDRGWRPRFERWFTAVQ